jgi:DNA-binding transcriptional ArsR family regulator
MPAKPPDDKSVGKALVKALGLETIKLDIEYRKGGKSQLMNPRRFRVFFHLWKNPCSHIRQISKSAKIPVESLKWHLKTLERSKFVHSKRFARRVAYYPKELIRKEDVELFAQLSDPKRKKIVSILGQGSDGVGLEEMSSKLSISKQALNHHISILKRLSVIRSAEGDRSGIYSLDERMNGLNQEYEGRADEVLAWLLSLLDEDCLNPEVKKRQEEFIRLRLSLGTGKKTIRLHMNPFNNIFQKK